MKSVQIGNRIVGDNYPCLISFEAGATFANMDEAKKMIVSAANAGADAIKFQTVMSGDADRLMSNKDIKINFTTPSGKKQESVYEAIKRRELSKESWNELVQYAREHKILFITTVEFPETVGFLIEAKVDAIKVSKGDINNVLLIDQIAKTNLPIILDGREKFEDVEKAIEICEKNGNYKIIIMHCPSGYPAEIGRAHV